MQQATCSVCIRQRSTKLACPSHFSDVREFDFDIHCVFGDAF